MEANFTNITVNYEFEQQSAGGSAHCSDVIGTPVGIHQGLAVDGFEDSQNTNEDPIAILPSWSSGDHEHSESPKVTFQEVIDVEDEQSLDNKNFRITLLENDECSGNQEVYRVVPEHGSDKSENFTVQSLEIVAAEPDGGLIIEIDDSSEEETGDPEISSPCTVEGLALSQFESAETSSSNVDEQPSSVAAQSSSAPEENWFKAFEDAMDDWYSRLSFHGPLKDSEIMESARQLAERFNFDFPDNGPWLEDFKNRQRRNERKRSMDRAVRKPEQPRRTGDSVDDRLQDNIMPENSPSGLEPPSSKARKRGRTLADLSGEDVDYPLLLISAQNGRLQEDELIKSKWKKACYSLRVTKPRKDKGATNAGKSMKIRHAPVAKSHSTSGKVGGLVRLASPSDGGDTEPSGILEDTTKPYAENHMIKKFESAFFNWYFDLTYKHKIMVEAIVFEVNAVRIAREHNLVNFRPTKMWLKMFLGHHGMWCHLGNERSLIKEPEVGLMKFRFDAEFEVWYHDFPRSTDALLADHIMEAAFRYRLKKYLVAVNDWHGAHSSTVSANEILTAEARFAETAGLSDADVYLIREFYRDLCVRHKLFYESVKGVYSEVSVLLPLALKAVASGWARKYRFSKFFPTERWMKRFLELNGLCFKENGVSSWYMFDPTSCNFVEFETFFCCWYRISALLGTDVPWLGELLQAVFEKSLAEPETQLKIEDSFTLREPKIEHVFTP